MCLRRKKLHSHFDAHLNLRKIILEKRPKVIVECGAGNGDCTRLLAHLLQAYPFELHVISDKIVDGLDPRIQWHIGLSYIEIPKFKDESIGLCIIDTDHNYWTLWKELVCVDSKIEEDGLIAFHDVEEFYHNTGMAMSYWNDEPYPKDEIMKMAEHGGVGDALIDFLSKFRDRFKLLSWTKESYGAALIQKKIIKQIAIVTPASNPTFAKPVIK